MSLLAIDRLTVRFGDTVALDSVSMTVAPGEVVALLGRSGSGKSTLAAAALGLLPDGAVVSGQARVDGIDLVDADERRRRAIRGGRVGLVMQDPAAALNPALGIGAQIGEALGVHRRMPRRTRVAEVAALMARVGLVVPPDRRPFALSGGQRQRAAIAAAIAAGPALLIADEPTAALDPLARAEIANLLVGLARERGLGLLFISHDLPLVASISDRLVVLDGGRVVEQGDTGACLGQPRSVVLRAMVAAERRDATTPPLPRPGALLQAQGFGRVYSRAGWRRAATPALAEVDLVIAPGETVAVVGASGSGKTTLARLVLGLDRPTSGIIRLEGRAWGVDGRMPLSMRARLQAVFQDPGESLDPAMPIGSSVAEPLGLWPARLSPGERDRRVAAALDLVELNPSLASRLPAAFSGGQRQRIALARALILRPALVVLDEALSALDPALRVEMADLLVRLQAELGLSYLFIAHDLAMVRRIAHRVVALRHGRVVAQGPTERMLDAPADDYLAAMVRASPTLDQALTRRGPQPPDPTRPGSPPR